IFKQRLDRMGPTCNNDPSFLLVITIDTLYSVWNLPNAPKPRAVPFDEGSFNPSIITSPNFQLLYFIPR
ncbi:hypothetical protein HAX54_005946, partial [Datura stramonium]|nr:hypothetical protein [Datura stramonium]